MKEGVIVKKIRTVETLGAPPVKIKWRKTENNTMRFSRFPPIPFTKKKDGQQMQTGNDLGQGSPYHLTQWKNSS
jgi:hypothetical protein